MILSPHVTSIVTDRIYKHLSRDKKLSESIADLKIDMSQPLFCRLIITSTDEGIHEVHNKLVWILRVANSCTPIAEIWIDGIQMRFEDVIPISPSVQISAGKADQKLLMQQQRQKSQILESAITALAENYSVFLISHEGQYEYVQFHAGTESLIPASDLIGKFLHEVVGTATTETILECMRQARQLDKPQECVYDVVFKSGERRWYEGRAYPIQDGNIQLFTVKRIH